MNTVHTLAAACAALAFAAPAALGQAVTPFVNGGFELDSDNSDGLVGFTLIDNDGFSGFTPGGDDNFDSTFLFFGGGSALEVDAASRLPVTPGVEYNLQFDAFGFGGDASADDVFLSFVFFGPDGAETGRLDQGINFENGVKIDDFDAPTLVAPDGSATVGFTLFGADGAAIDNLELVSGVIPEPTAAAGLAGLLCLTGLRRRR